MIYGWTPGIGDPTVVGWLTVVAYGVAAMLCWRASARDRQSSRLWSLLVMAMLLLGINKQLDLQSLFTAVGRHVAQVDHWYGDRRIVQHDFILAVLAAAVVMSLIALLVVRRGSWAIKGASLGFILLCAFIVIRAASFHDMDAFLHVTILNLQWNHVLELGGIGVIAVSAWSARPPKHVKRRRR